MGGYLSDLSHNSALNGAPLKVRFPIFKLRTNLSSLHEEAADVPTMAAPVINYDPSTKGQHEVHLYIFN